MPRGLPSKNLLTRPLDTNGDGTGDIVAIGNYTGVSVKFFAFPPPEEDYNIHLFTVRMLVVGAISEEKYGSGPPLSTPIFFELIDADGDNNNFGMAPIFQNADWNLLARKQIDYSSKSMEVGIHFEDLFDDGIKLYGRNAESFGIRITNEDMSTRFIFQSFGIAGQRWLNGD